MADNIRVKDSLSGLDVPVATDDIGGVDYQRVKAGWGVDGVYAETADADGVRFPVGGAQVGLTTETAPASDTAASGLNGRLQRVAQRLTSLIAQLPAALGQTTMAASLPVTLASNQSAVPASQSGTWTVQPGNTANTTAWKVDGSAVTQPVSGTVTANAGTNLNTSALVTETNDAARQGGVTETAPTTDTASSGLNGRLQRIAQRLTSLIALLPASLGQKTMAGSLAVTLASDQPAQSVTGTFWQATQPVSGSVAVTGTVTANAGTNTSTAALAAATATDAGDEAATDEAIAGAAANTRLIGFSARETTGTAGAVFNIRAGTSNAGALLVTVSLGVSESAREWYGPDGIAAAAGVWLERVSGQVSVVGYYKVAS